MFKLNTFALSLIGVTMISSIHAQNSTQDSRKNEEITIAIKSDQAPTPVGPYSQAVLTNNSQMLFVSGTLPYDPVTKELITDIKAATAQILEYIKATLATAGMDLTHVVKSNVYLTDMKNFAAFNETYAAYFKDCPVLPARATVAVAGLPKGALIEIEVVAAKAA